MKKSRFTDSQIMEALRQAEAVSNAPAEPVTSFQNTPVIPDAVKHQLWQQMKAADIARAANQIQPNETDLNKARMIYADQQRQVNKDYERSGAEPTPTSCCFGFNAQYLSRATALESRSRI
jgi:hypothetical protein